MKKSNLYFQHVYGRKNLLMEFFNEVFLKISSYPRMVIEVMIRKNFGERYFSLATAICIFAILAFLPYAGESLFGGFFSSNLDKYSWYLFDALFAGCIIKHLWEGSYAPGVFDFGRFSLYAGDIHPLFSTLNIWGWKPDVRTIEVILEPGLFFIIGLVLNQMGLCLGLLLVVVSLIYCLSYYAAYAKGDNFIMNMIDEMIMNEETENAFVRGDSGDQTRGVRFYAERPKLYAMREKVAEAMVHDASKVEFTLAE